MDTRRLVRPDLDAFGKLSQQLEMATSSKASLELICGNNLFPKGIELAGPVIAPQQGLLILNQAFAFDGHRDSLRIRVSANAKDAPVRAAAILPILTAMAKTQFRFPLKGVWIVKSGPSFHTHHRWGRPSEFGLDIVKFAADGRSHKNNGDRFTDYYAYGEDVLAAADGRVVRAVNNQSEPTDLLKRSGEVFQAFSQRTAAYEQTLLSRGIDAITGNHIMIDHGNGEYSLYAHLQPGSVRVQVGEKVKAGDPIAKIGGSGNALVEPHLHFHVCDQPTPLSCAGIPTEFTNVETPFASFAPRPLQSGDIVIAR
jgi:murein DD-endopeptidase MepM/ murein hydrolase activator NlpD